MASDNFVDYVKIHCTSGNGGGGSTHFRREKYIPKGGPDGGDGGRGGHVILRGNKQLWTLLHLKFKKHIKAGHGAHGAGNLKSGSQGDDVYIDVPLGTLAKDGETGEVCSKSQKRAKNALFNAADAAEWVTTTLSLQPIKPLAMLSQARNDLKVGRYSSSKS